MLRGIRKLCLSWGFQKQAVWIDENNFTVNFNMNRIAKVDISDGKIFVTYGDDWEEFLKEGNLNELIEKSNQMLDRSGFGLGRGKGKDKGKQRGNLTI